MPGQGDHAGPGQYVADQGYDLAPEAIARQTLEGGGAQLGVLGAADTVLAAGSRSVPGLQVGELADPGAGGKGGQPVALDLVKAQLGPGASATGGHLPPGQGGGRGLGAPAPSIRTRTFLPGLVLSPGRPAGGAGRPIPLR